MYCVIVGDIVESKEIAFDAREAVTKTAKDVFNRINTDYMDYILADFGLVRGDAFEGVLLTQRQAPQIMQEIIKAFYSVEKTKVRISIVLGQLTTISNDRNETDGPAFYKAFANINKMKEQKSNHWLQVAFEVQPLVQPLIDSLLMLITELTERWTERQHEIVWMMEEFSEQYLVSKKLNVSKSVISKQLKAAGYETYHQAWLNLERFLADFEETSVTEPKRQEAEYTAYYSVAMRKRIQQNYEEALVLIRKALQLARRELGERDPQLVKIYNGLAEILMKIGFFKEAEEALAISLKLQEALPKTRLEYARTLTIEGALKVETDHIDDAVVIFETAENTVRNAVGEDHPFIDVCNHNIAAALNHKKYFPRALEYYFRLLKHWSKKEYDAVKYADVLHSIALCYHMLGEERKTLDYAAEALEIYKENLPSKHNHIFQTEELLKATEKHREE